ncbi:glycosyltransferase family 2 protein [Ferruginibacter sp. SUN106]|uniref:glycosyltransferase family 2 protein n=1 Tax=Ferruginibacter sp. SUN106 TaxID=2978348 RepID=UPI003D360558
MNKLSVVVITFNEEKNIGRCLDSVKPVADEIIVLDSFSTDTTVSIALQKGAVIHQQSFAGYIQQKNKAIKLASNNNVLLLDADEALSDELAMSIAGVKQDSAQKAFTMNRCNIYCGRPIRHGLWYPDRKLRLFDKRIGSCGGLNPHDKIILTENCGVQQLKGDLLHYTYQSFDEYMIRNEEVSNTAAESIFNSGKKVHWAKIFLSPAWAFINGYFLRLGFLDGRNGLVIATHTASQSYKKYYKLKQLQKRAAGKMHWQNAKF